MAGEYHHGLVERWSGKLFRWIMAYLFLFGVYGLALSVLHFNIGAFIFGVIFVSPYLLIRWRDPDSTTLPFHGIARRRIFGG